MMARSFSDLSNYIVRLPALLCMAFALVTTNAVYASDDKDTISVVGKGEISAEPDQVILSMSVSAINLNVNAAKQEADQKYKMVLAAAKGQGVARTDIQVTSINMQPEYNWRNNTQVLIGTRVSRSLSITVNDVESVAPLLQELVESEVSTINSVQTGFQDREGMARKALAAAIADAKDKASFLAKQFGKELGSAHTIAEFSQPNPVFRPFNSGMMEAKLTSAEPPQEHFGKQQVTARVSVVFHAE